MPSLISKSQYAKTKWGGAEEPTISIKLITDNFEYDLESAATVE